MRQWTRDLGCFFVKQMKRQQAEVREKHLDARQLAGFSKAKAKEVKNFVVAEAFKALPSHLKPSRDQVLKMRWLLTWKLDEDPEKGVEPLNRDKSVASEGSCRGVRIHGSYVRTPSH